MHYLYTAYTPQVTTIRLELHRVLNNLLSRPEAGLANAPPVRSPVTQVPFTPTGTTPPSHTQPPPLCVRRALCTQGA